MYVNKLPADTFTFDHVYMTVDSTRVRLLVGDPDTKFPLASVTKAIAAWSVLVAVSEGRIGLDDPAGPEGSTFRHLLAHAAGLPMEKGAPIARPGSRRIYTNYGFEVLGEELADRVGMPIQDWIKESVLEPLGMEDTRINGSIAHSGRATADDIARLALELLNPTLVDRELAVEATRPAFVELTGILPGYGKQQENWWGLGFEMKGAKEPHWLGETFSARTYGHFGQSGSFLWIDPEIRKAGVFLGAEKFSETHKALWPALTDQMRMI